MAEIVFVTLFLGLVSGVHPLELRADPAIKTVRVTLGSRAVAELRQPPWQTTIDFGPMLEPAEVTAIGYDANGNEIARASQVVNLPRPFADLAIVVDRVEGVPSKVHVIGKHLQFAKPKSAIVKVDGKPLQVDSTFTAPLPPLDWLKPHVITAEMHFVDGLTAKREIAVAGGSYVAESQLTPVLVSVKAAANFDGCFSSDGARLVAHAVEKPYALVIVVQDPDATDAKQRLAMMNARFRGNWNRRTFLREFSLDREITERVTWPIAQRFVSPSSESALFEHSEDSHSDFVTIFSSRMPGTDWLHVPRRFADAVAVGGLAAIRFPQRRAVVFLLGFEHDSSDQSPQSVRHYLESVGVPLFVWSLGGPRPDLGGEWGEVVDISTRDKFHDAVVRLRETLNHQRIVWLPVGPLAALHVKTDPRCAVATVTP